MKRKNLTSKQIKAVSRFMEYFADLHKDGALHLLDLEGPSEIQKLFNPIAGCWRDALRTPSESIVLEKKQKTMAYSIEQLQGKAIVVESHTLGVVIGEYVQIFRASLLKGSPYPGAGSIYLPLGANTYRLATEADFDEYRVAWHPEYELIVD